jgi:hypothetical protein
VRRCAGPCGRPMDVQADPDRGVVKHVARGLCGTCYSDEELRLDHPRRLRPADELLDEWDIMRCAGATRMEAATRLGMTEGGLHRMQQRHRDDPRAQLGLRKLAHVPVRDEATGRWAG